MEGNFKVLSIDLNVFKEILYWITAAMAIYGFIFLVRVKRNPLSVLDSDTQRMISGVKTVWGQLTANTRFHGIATTNPNVISARQKIVKNVQADPILGRFTKGMNEKEMFGFATSDDFIRILRGFGITAQMGLGVLSTLKDAIFGKSEDEGENVAVKKEKKGKVFKPSSAPIMR